MPHNHLEGMNNEWRIVRETPYSSIFRGRTPKGLEFSVDFHFTPPTNAMVSIVFVGSKGSFTDGVVHDIFADLERIALRRGHYKVIDYSLAFADSISEGNYSVSDQWRKIFWKE